MNRYLVTYLVPPNLKEKTEYVDADTFGDFGPPPFLDAYSFQKDGKCIAVFQKMPDGPNLAPKNR